MLKPLLTSEQAFHVISYLPQLSTGSGSNYTAGLIRKSTLRHTGVEPASG